MNTIIKRSSVLGLLLAVSTCGGEEAPEASDPNLVPSDSLIVTGVPREPLTEADLDGMSLSNLSVEIPWTRNVVSRDAGPVAPPSYVEGVEVSSHDGFDRVQFQLASSAPLPGYRIQFLSGGLTVPCAGEDTVVGEEGDRLLFMEFAPARIPEGSAASPHRGMNTLGLTRLLEGGINCETGEGLRWVSFLAEGDQLRVLEMRNPQRVIVDIR